MYVYFPKELITHFSILFSIRKMEVEKKLPIFLKGEKVDMKEENPVLLSYTFYFLTKLYISQMCLLFLPQPI